MAETNRIEYKRVLISELHHGQDINRLKIVLVEQKYTVKWLVEQIGQDPVTVSKWCTNII